MTDNNTGQTQDQTELARDIALVACECGGASYMDRRECEFERLRSGSVFRGTETAYRVDCDECPHAVEAPDPESARRLWNRAHSPRGVSAVEEILSQAVKHLQVWLDLDECECEMGEHRCGRDEVEQTVSAALAALDPVP